ncbi:MAG: DUF2125 domain-containing protein [Rhodobacterales bacterium]
MRILLGIFGFAVLAWFGYWFIGSNAMETGLKSWLQDRQDSGWVADYTSLDVQGFPNRFDATVINIDLADPKYGWAWTAPEFQILTLSYTPNHFIAVWPHKQTVSTPYETHIITSKDMRASFVFEPNTSLALKRSTLTLKDLTVTSGRGEQSSIASAVLATRQTEGVKFAHDIAFDAKGFMPSKSLKARLDPAAILPPAFKTVSLRSTATFDAPWDRLAIEDVKPNLTRLDITEFDAKWGEVQIQATGSVKVDEEGYPTGSIAVRAKNWRALIRLAVASGALDAGTAQSLETGLGLIAMLSGNNNTLDVPLIFSKHIMSIGPIPIGAAPRLKRY